MKAVVYRWNQRDGHASWRPRSLVDMRGPRFPEEYHELLELEAGCIAEVYEQYASMLGDVVFLGEDQGEGVGLTLTVYVGGPMGWELVKFGSRWSSPD